jgi:hypothetical protein
MHSAEAGRGRREADGYSDREKYYFGTYARFLLRIPAHCWLTMDIPSGINIATLMHGGSVCFVTVNRETTFQTAIEINQKEGYYLLGWLPTGEWK